MNTTFVKKQVKQLLLVLCKKLFSLYLLKLMNDR